MVGRLHGLLGRVYGRHRQQKLGLSFGFFLALCLCLLLLRRRLRCPFACLDWLPVKRLSRIPLLNSISDAEL